MSQTETGERVAVVRLRAPGGPEQLVVEATKRPTPGPAEALVRVCAAAITRNELEWPVDRLPRSRPMSCPVSSPRSERT